MSNYWSFISKLKHLNFNTLKFNFKYFDFKTAIKFPVIVSSSVYLKKMAGKIVLDFPWETGSVLLGFGDVGIFDKHTSRSIWEVNSGTVVFKGRAAIRHGSKISVNNGMLQFGENFKITAESTVVCTDASVVFGNNNLLSWDILIMTSDFHPIFDAAGDYINQPKNIIFGNDVWIGCRTTVLKGSRIPNGCVIAASSLVAAEFMNKNTLLGGHPAKELKKEITWRDA